MSARLKESTIRHKRVICETKILPFFGNMPINEIKASDVRRWQNRLMCDEHNYKDTYLKTINNQLTCIINYAKRFYDLNTNPCGKAGSIGKSSADEMNYWTLEEYMEFREGIKDSPVSYMCFEVLYWTEIREGELLALTASDIDTENRLISITKKLSAYWQQRCNYNSQNTKKQPESSDTRISVQGACGLHGIKIFSHAGGQTFSIYKILSFPRNDSWM